MTSLVPMSVPTVATQSTKVYRHTRDVYFLGVRGQGKTVYFCSMYIKSAEGTDSISFTEDSAAYLQPLAKELNAGRSIAASARGLPTNLQFTLTTADGTWAVQSCDMAGALVETIDGKRSEDKLATDVWDRLRRASGIICLLNMDQLTSPESCDRIHEVNLLLESLATEYQTVGSPIPIAIVFSQADRVFGPMTDFASMQSLLMKHLESQPKMETIVRAVQRRASRVGVFAVSAFGHSPDGTSPPPTGVEPLGLITPWAWVAAQTDEHRFAAAEHQAAPFVQRTYPKYAAAAGVFTTNHAIASIKPTNTVAAKFRNRIQELQRASWRRFTRQLIAGTTAAVVVYIGLLGLRDWNQYREVTQLIADPTAVRETVVRRANEFLDGTNPASKVLGTKPEIERLLAEYRERLHSQDEAKSLAYCDAHPGDANAELRMAEITELVKQYPKTSEKIQTRATEAQHALERHRTRIQQADREAVLTFCDQNPGSEKAQDCERRVRDYLAKYPGGANHDEMVRLAEARGVLGTKFREDQKFTDESRQLSEAVATTRSSGTAAGSYAAIKLVLNFIDRYETSRDIAEFRSLIAELDREANSRFRDETNNHLAKLDASRVEAKQDRLAALELARKRRPSAFPDELFQPLKTKLREELANTRVAEFAEIAKNLDKFERTTTMFGELSKDRDVTNFPAVKQQLETTYSQAATDCDKHLWSKVRDAAGNTPAHLTATESAISTYLTIARPVSAMKSDAEKFAKWFKDARSGMNVNVYLKSVYVPSGSKYSRTWGSTQAFAILTLGKLGGKAEDAKEVTADTPSAVNLLIGKFHVKFGTEQSMTLQLGTYRSLFYSHVMSEVKTVKDGTWIGYQLNDTYQFSEDLRATIECIEVIPPLMPEYRGIK